jgi:hypothetical protein
MYGSCMTDIIVGVAQIFANSDPWGTPSVPC